MGVEARSVEELVALCEAGGLPRYVNFWGHQPQPDGTLGPSCLSQWWPAGFAADGQVFASAEHYMMWRKAQLFGDHDVAAEVLKATSPARAKELGRQVSGFDSEMWTRHRWEIVVSGSLAKFTSDPALTAYLVGTGDARSRRGIAGRPDLGHRAHGGRPARRRTVSVAGPQPARVRPDGGPEPDRGDR